MHDLVPLGDASLPPLVTVGWDHDRATFFAQVVQDHLDAAGNEGRVDLVRLGVTPYEMPTARQAIDAVRAWAHVPRELEQHLEADAGRPENRVASFHTGNLATMLCTEGILTDWAEPQPVSAWGPAALAAGNPADALFDEAVPDLVGQVPPHHASAAFPPLGGLDQATTSSPEAGPPPPARAATGPRR
jgi:hypothetical protein